MTAIRVFLGGEGQNELGSRCGDPAYQNDGSPGVVEALLRRAQPHGWKVVGACQWCRIRKIRATGKSPKDERNVLGLVLEAKRAGANVLAFVRDADGDEDRPRVITDAVERARAEFPSVSVVGAAAIPVLEGWILALSGETGTESMGKVTAQKRLAGRGIPNKNTEAMVRAVADSTGKQLPQDAKSLRGWLTTAEKALRP